MFWANLLIVLLGWIQTKTVVHVLRIPFRYLAPIILLLATVGAYALRNLMIDVWIMYFAGVLGFFMRSTGYSPAGIILGLILGSLGESAFSKSMQLMNYDFLGFFSRPISGILLALGGLAIVSSIWTEIKTSRKPL